MDDRETLLLVVALVGWSWWLSELSMRLMWQRMAKDWKDLCESYAENLDNSLSPPGER